MSKEEKLLILQMVADGKITPEQGVELLKAIGADRQVPPRPQGPWVKVVERRATGSPGKPEGAAGVGVDSAGAAGENIGKTVDEVVDRAVRAAEQVAEGVARQAEEISRQVAERVAKIGEKASFGGEELAKSAEGLGRLIAGLFTRGIGFVGGPEHEFVDEIAGELPDHGEIAVTLSTANGRITVTSWDKPGFLLRVTKKVSAPTEAEAQKLVKDVYTFHQDGLVLSAQSREQSWSPGCNLAIRFDLSLPRGRMASLTLHTANGRIVVEGMSGSKLEANTANGRIVVSQSSFDESRVYTANGRIEYQGRASVLDASTANGRMEIDLSGAGTWKCHTANGKVEVRIRREPQTAYEVDASTVMGKIEVTDMDDAEVLADETRQRFGAKRYWARTRGFDQASSRGVLKASSAMGKVIVSL